MESEPEPVQPQVTQPLNYPYQTIIIIVLIIILTLSFLGINLFFLIGRAFDIITPITGDAISDLGNSTGKIIDKTADVITDTGKTGLDIVNGTFHSIGDLLIKGSEHSYQKKEPEPTNSTNPIQSKNTAAKWCLVGEYRERKGCVEIDESDKCLSGEIFPSQHLCLNSGTLSSDGNMAIPPQMPT